MREISRLDFRSRRDVSESVAGSSLAPHGSLGPPHTSASMKLPSIAFLSCVVGAYIPRALGAQTAVAVEAGVAVPSGHLSQRRGAGPHIGAGVTLGDEDRRVRLRLAADATWLTGRTVSASADPASSVEYSTMSVVGAHAYAVAGSRGPTRIYGLAGLGLFHASGADEQGSGGRTGMSVGVGAGVEIPLHGRLRASIETRFEGLLADYGVGESQTPTYWPVVLRLRF